MLINVNCTVRTASGKVSKGFGSMPLGNGRSFPSRSMSYDTTLGAMKTLTGRISRYVPHLPRYYGLLRLLPIRSYPSGRPLGPRTSPDGEEIESSLRFLDNPCGNMPRARDSGDPSTTSQ